MYKNYFKIKKIFFILILIINKKIEKIKAKFLAILDRILNKKIFYYKYNI